MAQLTAVILSHHMKMPHLHEGQDLDHQLQLSELEIFFQNYAVFYIVMSSLNYLNNAYDQHF